MNNKADIKYFNSIMNYELSHTSSWIVLYMWLGDKNLYPEHYIKYSKN